MNRPAVVVGLAACLISVAPGATGATEAPWLIPPVNGPVTRDYEEPQHRFGRGHRGIDIAAPSGAVVRAAAPGVVSFAGLVANTRAVTIDHDGDLETTYSDLATVDVIAGQRVTEGTIVGTAGRSHHDSAPGLHFGVKLQERYVDPRVMLAALDVAGAIHLAPLTWQPPEEMGEGFAAAFRDAGTAHVDCLDPPDLTAGTTPPPSENVAVAVAGIGSSTDGGSIYEDGPEQLGYRDVYRFSYAGVDADDAHIPYGPEETYGDINVAAGKLRAQLAEIARRHPGRAVDLFAHSQGGMVARTLLARAAVTSDVDLPPIAHLVTFATPHQGAPLAGTAVEMERHPIGRAVLRLATRASRSLSLPDPTSEAVRQLAPGSELMQALAGETVLYGTRVLTLAIPNDVVVPAHAALLEEAETKVVAPGGLWGHDAILGSSEALATAYQFLRGGPGPCRAGWDRWGPRFGSAIGWLEGRLEDLPGALVRRGF